MDHTELKLDDCFQFGLGAFETIAIENGAPVFLKQHLKRLNRTAVFLGLGSCQERGITADALADWLQNRSDDPSIHHGALKLMLSKENLLLRLRPNPYTPERYQRGFVMDFSQVRRNETSPLVYHKTMNYGDCLLEKRSAAAAGMDERIFLNTRGEVCEGCVSNVFFIRKGILFTPQLSCGLLPGIMREYLLSEYDVCETVIRPDEISDFEECFVTNSLMGIMPVRQLGTTIFPSRQYTQNLADNYSRYLGLVCS